MDADLATLCQSCGLCCDGSLFGRVPLHPEEVPAARKNRLRVLYNKKAFEQPCTALSEGQWRSGARRVCSIYDERPDSCRLFTCRLRERHRLEGGPIGPRIAAVERVRQIVAELRGLGLSQADFAGGCRSRPHFSASVIDIYAELQKRLEEDFARA